MSRWRPSPAEERWLAAAAEIGDAVPRAALAERGGGWRSSGLLARSALFVLGLVAAALVVFILGAGQEIHLLVGGLVAALAAEWLTVQKRLFASGFEEGLTVAGFLLAGAWLATTLDSWTGYDGSSLPTLIMIGAACAAGVRRLNPFVTACAAIAFVHWAGTTAPARTLDGLIGNGMTILVLGCVLAALALVLGAQGYRRPSHDRMLDWLVVTLPVTAYLLQATGSRLDPSYAANGTGMGWIAIVLLAVVAAAMLRTGLERRRHAPLWGFLGCMACLGMELSTVVPLATETWLVLCGIVSLVAGVALDRYLRQPRDGVTSALLTQREGPLDLLQIAGAALLAKRAGPEAPPAESTFEGSGGRFGGGGASGSY